MTKPIESAVRTLPLYDPSPADADGWHAVRSPGGYEWWYFDAEDDRGQFRLVAGLCEGFVFHPGYLRRYYRYLAEPTRHAPPLPGEYPCAFFAVYEKGRLLAEYLTQVRPEEFSASAAGPQVRVGTNQLSRGQDGSLRLQMSGGRLSAELAYQPQFPKSAVGEECADVLPSPGTPGEGQGEGLLPPVLGDPRKQKDPRPSPLPEYREREKRSGVDGCEALERDFLSRKMTGADHRWIIANPLCRVQGEVQLAGPDGGSRRVIGFSGRGYHDHNFGSAPLGPGLRRWIRGRTLWDDGMLAFHYARPRRRRLGDEVSLVRADEKGVREVPVTLTRSDWSGRSALAVRYPTRLHLKAGDVATGDIKLESPRVIHATAFQLRLIYEAQFGDRRGEALCEVGYPRRLTWPVIGRMIQRSIVAQ